MKLLRLAVFMISATVCLPAHAGDDQKLWQVIEDMQQRIERLESEVGITGKEQSRETTAQPQVTGRGRGYVRYWLLGTRNFDPDSKPMREGFMTLDDSISLNPTSYGYESSLFDQHKDPSLFPLAIVMIEAELLVAEGGLYTLIVNPTPPREIGGAGNVEVSARISIAGKPVFDMPFSSSLSGHQQELRLNRGRQPVQIKILARSPGFGPSPTKAEVYIGLRADGEINSFPIVGRLQAER